MRPHLSFTVVLLLFLALPAFGMGDRGGAGGTRIARGSQAPDFTLQDLTGKRVTLSKLRGKVVFLNFWATWCPPCREEMPAMERLNEVFASSDFVMLALNVESDGARTVPPYLAASPVSFTILLDASGEAQRLYNVFRFPETFLIDKQGRIVEHFIGAHDWSSLAILRQVRALTHE